MPNPRKCKITKSLPPLAIAAAAGIIYYFTNPNPGHFYDYTSRIALALLNGNLGVAEQPPSWLSEMVPHNGLYYSVFPLGAVLSVIPAAALQMIGVINGFPAAAIVATVAALSAAFFFALAGRYELTPSKRAVLSLFPLLGTWTWANLAFGGAWHIALGFAVLGEAGALYFLLVRQKPFLAGFFFAVGFGNRTEIIALFPIFFYLLLRGRVRSVVDIPKQLGRIAAFSALPFALGAATLAYNYARFESPFDFGYARIPGVLSEPWYSGGIFSLSAIPLNAKEMLFQGWKRLAEYPYYVPTGFGGSIFMASPALFLLFRRGGADRALKATAWAAVLILTFILWIHGNPGGWQVSYRYAMVLLPWMYLIILESSPKRLTASEIALFAISALINGWAAYLFLRTNYVTP
ncbi:MAG: hypothetical protein ACT4NX_00385 [Deltaproteobacteria bacterium]